MSKLNKHKFIFYSLFCWFLFFLFFGSNEIRAQNEYRFSEAIHDLPIADGLSEIQERIVNFNQTGGRIIETYMVLEGDNFSDAEEVQKYYQQILPQFGWSYQGRDTYKRQNEILSIQSISEDNYKKPLIRFALRPQ